MGSIGAGGLLLAVLPGPSCAEPLHLHCRTINQGWYSYYSCASGWFGPNAPPVRNTVVLKVRAAALPLCALQSTIDVQTPPVSQLKVRSTGGGRPICTLLHSLQSYDQQLLAGSASS